MAFYPIIDSKMVYGKTKEEIEQNILAANEEGYEIASNTQLWNSQLSDRPVAYRQAMVKRENTDPQFIANMTASIKKMLEDKDVEDVKQDGSLAEIIAKTLEPIQAQNTQIIGQNDQVIELLTKIEENTRPATTTE